MVLASRNQREGYFAGREGHKCRRCPRGMVIATLSNRPNGDRMRLFPLIDWRRIHAYRRRFKNQE